MSNDNRSPFAEALRRLLEMPDGYSKTEWARLLGVTPSAISQWLGDQTVPRAFVLRALVDAVAWRFGPAALDEFWELSDLPATQISPIGGRMSPTVRQYMVEPLVEGFQRLLRTLRPEAQEEVLLDAAEACRAILSGARAEAGTVDAGRGTVAAAETGWPPVEKVQVRRVNKGVADAA